MEELGGELRGALIAVLGDKDGRYDFNDTGTIEIGGQKVLDGEGYFRGCRAVYWSNRKDAICFETGRGLFYVSEIDVRNFLGGK